MKHLVDCICRRCGKAYSVYPCFAKKTKYCGRLCHNRSNAEANSVRFRGETHWNTGKRFRTSEWVTIICSGCTKKFECEPNQYKSGKKFCSKDCYDRYQRTGETPKRYWIRRSTELYGPGCEKCGEKDTKIDTHHIDRDRTNNPDDGSNWMRLCDTCHKLVHFAMKKRAPAISRDEFLSDAFEP